MPLGPRKRDPDMRDKQGMMVNPKFLGVTRLPDNVSGEGNTANVHPKNKQYFSAKVQNSSPKYMDRNDMMDKSNFGKVI